MSNLVSRAFPSHAAYLSFKPIQLYQKDWSEIVKNWSYKECGLSELFLKQCKPEQEQQNKKRSGHAYKSQL